MVAAADRREYDTEVKERELFCCSVRSTGFKLLVKFQTRSRYVDLPEQDFEIRGH